MIDVFLLNNQKSLLEIISTIASVFTALSAMAAVIFYIYSRNKDRKSEVFNQIRFLKDKILPPQNEIIQANGKYIPKVEVKCFDFKKMKEEKDDIFSEQEKLGKSDGYVKQTFILNDLEELSLRIIHYGNQNNPMLNCIKDSFIDTVEYNTYTLLMQRQISNNVYNGIMKLYKKWKKFK